jgi:hypothetical protein
MRTNVSELRLTHTVLSAFLAFICLQVPLQFVHTVPNTSTPQQITSSVTTSEHSHAESVACLLHLLCMLLFFLASFTRRRLLFFCICVCVALCVQNAAVLKGE